MNKVRFWFAVFFSLAVLMCYGEEEYYVGVATTITLGERFNPATSWHYGIGWSQATGYDANQAAEQACNESAGVKCWHWMSSMKGGCIVLVQGTWTDQGMEPLSELFSRTSTLGIEIAERDALHICEAFIHSGKPQGMVTSWECTPRVTFCSSQVAAHTQPIPSVSSLDSTEPSESSGDESGATPWRDIIRVPIVAYPDSGSYYWDTDGWEPGQRSQNYEENVGARLFGCLMVYQKGLYNDGEYLIGVTNYCDEPVIFVACSIVDDKPNCRPVGPDFQPISLLVKYGRGTLNWIKADQGTDLVLAMASYSEQARALSLPYDENGHIRYRDLAKSQIEEIKQFEESLARDLEAEFNTYQ